MATYYVSPSGNDTTGTGAIGAPWKTILKGCQNLSPGDTLNLRGGTYAEGMIFNNHQSIFSYGTQESERITIQGYTGESAIFRPTASQAFRFQRTCSWLTLKDFIIDGVNMGTVTSAGAIHILTQHGVTQQGIIIDGLTITNVPSHGIRGSDFFLDCIIRNCEISDVGRTDGQANGIYSAGGTNNIIENNYVYYTSARTIVNHGCIRDYVNDATIGTVGAGGGPAVPEGSGSIIHKNRTKGGQVGIVTAGHDQVIKNNLCILTSTGTIGIEVIEQPTNGTNDGFDIWNNTIVTADGVAAGTKRGIFFFRGTATNVDLCNNGIRGMNEAIDLSGSSGTVTPIRNTTNLTTDPGFLDTSNDDYRITTAGLWDETGTDLADPEGVTTDIQGLARPQDTLYDVGAYEAEVPINSDPVVDLPSAAAVELNTSANITVNISDVDDDVVVVQVTKTGSMIVTEPTASGATVKGFN